VREFSVEPLYEVPAGANLTDVVHRNGEQTPELVSFSRKVDGRWQDVTARHFLDEVAAVARGLVAAGINAGDRVGIMSHTRYEWSLLDFAVWEAGAIVIPVYETSSAEQIAWILSDSGAVAVFTETTEMTALVESVRDQAPALTQVWQIEHSTEEPAGALAVLATGGADVAEEALTERRGTLNRDSVATIIYTSGTTGRPKGCVLTHANLLAECGNVVLYLSSVFKPGASTLLFIPMAHVFARVIHVGAIYSGVKLGHSSDTANIVAEFGDFKPTFILSVPRVFEKVYNASSQRAQADGKGKIFDAAAATAVAYSRAQDAGKVPVGLNLKHKVFDRLVYAKLRAALGGQATHAISGGAPLGERLIHFFRGIGLFISEGYGLTETTAACSVNPYPGAKAGTVGPPVPGTSVKIADDGEILVKGGEVFGGYWNNEAATKEAIVDGWFHTGDLGSLDEQGFLSITGRKKELLVTAGGKNVAPAVLEDRINAHPLVAQSMVVGDQQPFIAALVTLDPEALPFWLKQQGRDEATPLEQLAADPALLAEIEIAIDRANKAVSKAESIRKFKVLPVEWTVEGGQITPSLKLKRHVVMLEESAEIAALYAK